ncbi:MAG TPA: neuraminidase (sialidase), partial [Solibacterales bacterium]|nr:neuraminidase (sialidase) [Bryobacterales bacterium]
DGGKTWTKHGPVTFEGTPKLFPAPASYGLIQPAIVKLPDRRTLRMYVRATPQIGRVCYSDSTDGGRTWTVAKALSLAHPNSGIDAVHLRDGRIVL